MKTVTYTNKGIHGDQSHYYCNAFACNELPDRFLNSEVWILILNLSVLLPRWNLSIFLTESGKKVFLRVWEFFRCLAILPNGSPQGIATTFFFGYFNLINLVFEWNLLLIFIVSNVSFAILKGWTKTCWMRHFTRKFYFFVHLNIEFELLILQLLKHS